MVGRRGQLCRAWPTTRPRHITLRFTGGGLTSAATSSIVVSPAAPSQLVIHTQPSASALVGQAFGTQPVISIEDRFGNLETGDNSTVVTAALNSGAGPLQGTTTATAVGGVARFTNLADSTAESITLSFTGGGLTPAVSSPVVVSPAVDLRISSFTASPEPVEVGAKLTYTVVVTNNGPSPATSVTVTSPLGTGVSYVGRVGYRQPSGLDCRGQPGHAGPGRLGNVELHGDAQRDRIAHRLGQRVGDRDRYGSVQQLGRPCRPPWSIGWEPSSSARPATPCRRTPARPRSP